MAQPTIFSSTSTECVFSIAYRLGADAPSQEFLDAVYLHQKFSKPITWEFWLEVRSLVDRVVEVYDQPDMSIWEASLTCRSDLH
jgi:hypothetical protein